MKQILILILFFCSFTVNAQLTPVNKKLLLTMEDSLNLYSKKMVMAQDPSTRFYADSVFIKKFVQALKVPGSFEYAFDSVKTVSKLYAPDSLFRIYTWEIQKDESYFRQFGAIQMHTTDGSLKLFPLFDQSDYASIPTDSVRTNRNWIGAIYYQVVMKEFNGKKYYTLIGLDDNDFTSTRKWIEVLYFDANGQPVFGGDFFTYRNEDNKPEQPVARFCLEFKKDAKARLNYDKQLDIITFDHLVSETANDNSKYNLIPDGDYEGFKWSNGKWVHVSKIFAEQKLKDGEAPVPVPFRDDDGNPLN
ncbi:hypothetical protein FRZ67_05030 [Panacibacter ginsenosidivorans]|uniref:GLPGLI family protein n=1 Tax=Panacibacter ginsenosidivorans TaxID=1813871 RepID=A0A5B8V718_9BACT|nr:hypothetical protein [Panacibacter ginsenosidivorans]QEC66693.1 hypothetical protein FRZ67_05030 [Panacibacter ginsenosidivorans]